MYFTEITDYSNSVSTTYGGTSHSIYNLNHPSRESVVENNDCRHHLLTLILLFV